jgi:hypothetical protein
MADCKDQFCVSVRVRIMFSWFKVRRMIEQAVEDIRGLACVTGDDLGIEWNPEIGNVRVNMVLST